MVWDETLQLFKELTEAPGAPGFEGPVREILARRMAPLADRVYTDNLGSLVAEKRGTAASPKVMIAGHMDEVGFLVTRITTRASCGSSPWAAGGARCFWPSACT